MLTGSAFKNLFIATLVVFAGSEATRALEGKPPNIIMFCMDDLNDWVGPLGDEQAVTPNLDRLDGASGAGLQTDMARLSAQRGFVDAEYSWA